MSTGVAAGFRLVLHPIVGEHYVFAPFLLAILVTAWYGGRGPALVALVLGAFSLHYFFLRPNLASSSDALHHPVALLLFFATGLGMAFLAGSMHSAQRALRDAKDLLERRIAERTEDLVRNNEKLARSEELLSASLHWSHTGGWDLDLDDLSAYRTLEHDEIFGYGALLPSWTYKVFLEHVLPEDREDVDRRFQEAVAAGGDWDFECRIRRADGEVRWIWAAGGHTFGANANARRMAGIVQDITERKTAEIALRTERDKFATIVDTVPMVICSFRRRPGNRWTFPFAGPGIVQIYGIQASELTEDASQILDRIHPDDQTHFLTTLRESGTTMAPWRAEYRVRHPERGNLWVEAHAVPCREPDGHILWHGYLNDITERKVAEAAHQDRERLLRIVTGSARVGLVVVGAGYKYLFANEAYSEIFRLNTGAIIGRRVPEILPAAWAQIQPRLDRALAGERVVYELELPGQEGLPVRYFTVNYEPRSDEAGAASVVVVVMDVTERKLAELAALGSQARLEAALASMTDAVFISDAAGKFILFNDAFATFHRFKSKLECSRLLSNYPEIIDVFMENGEPAPLEMWAVSRALRGETVAHAEYGIRRKDSGEAWIGSYSFSPIRDHAGDIVGSVVVGRDITERRRIEKVLQDSETRYRTLFDYAPDGIVIASSESRYLDGNASICRMLGYTRDEFIGLDASDIIVPTEHEYIEQTLESIRNNATHQRGWHFRRKDGSVFEAEVIATMMPDGNLLGMIRDLSDRKQMEEARELFRALLDRSDDAIEVIDPEDGRFLDGNEVAWRSLGYSRGEFLSLRVHDIDPDPAQVPWAERMDVLRRSGFLIFETIHRRKDGSVFPVEVNAKHVRLNRDYMIAVVRDISERRRIEERGTAQNTVTRILAASPSLEEAARQILEALCRSFGWKRGELWRVDSGVEALQCLLAVQHDPGRALELDNVTAQFNFARDVGLPGQVWERGEPVWMPDVAGDARFLRAVPVVEVGLRGAVGFPIMLGDLVMGVLCFYGEQVDRPDDGLAAIFTTLGSQIGQFMERKRAEAELYASEERFRQITENIREVFWLNDPINKKILYASPAYEAVWGRPCETLFEKPGDWLEAIHPEDRNRVRGAFYDQQLGGRYSIEYRVVRPDQSIRWVLDRGFPIYRDTGELYRVAGVAEDITERRLAEEASHVQQSRLEGIVNSAMDGIITVGEDQRILLINAAAERMFGCRAGEVLGERVERFIPERFRAAHAAHVMQFGETGVAARAMGRFGPISGIRSSGEEFPIEASISQIEVDGNKLFTVTCRDVTERVHAAETQKKLEAQLQQSQKMEAFGQLAGGVAHDFNNLLTVISGYSEWLLNCLPPDWEHIGMIREINKAGDRAAALTRQLLAFSRRQLIEPKVLSLNSAVEGVEKMLRRMIGEDVQLATVLRPNIRPVKIDPGQIEQVLMNLAVNARDAMPNGGKLTIETREIQLDELFTTSHTAFSPGNYVLLALSDTGSGMPPEVKERIFEPFYTTKGVGKGTGLGLAVVHGIVEQSGGIVQVYSELGVGTTFKIFLPVVEASPVELRGDDRLDLPRGTETVLLVEDEDGVRELTALALGNFGYTVLTAPGGEEALRLMDGLERSIDLLITDVVMPELSGRELAELLWTRHRGLKVLFVSGYTDDVIVRHGVLRADVAFLHKPFTLNALARKVREVLDT